MLQPSPLYNIPEELYLWLPLIAPPSLSEPNKSAAAPISVSGLPFMEKRAKVKLELPLHVVVYEILTRLPVKTVSRFRCVSKTWNFQILQPRFRKEHSQRSQQNPLLLVVHNAFDGCPVSFSTYSEDGGSLLKRFPERLKKRVDFTLIQSCRGLVCMRSYIDGSISVCNPSTEEIIALPLGTRPDRDIWAGFGYAASTKEFKAVRFSDCIEDFSKLCCEVFTLGSSNNWRQARSNPPFSPVLCGHIPFLRGALHFLPSLDHNDILNDILEDHYIAAFDLDSEEYRVVPLPRIYIEERRHARQCVLAEDRGSLCVIFDWLAPNKMLQHWFLKDYDNGNWVKGYNINLFALCTPDNPTIHLLAASSLDNPIAFTRDAKILVPVVKNKVNPEWGYYSTQENRIVKTLECSAFGVLYTESFWPLGSR